MTTVEVSDMPAMTPDAILGLARAFMESRALLTAVELDVFTPLANRALIARFANGVKTSSSTAVRSARDSMKALASPRIASGVIAGMSLTSTVVIRPAARFYSSDGRADTRRPEDRRRRLRSGRGAVGGQTVKGMTTSSLGRWISSSYRPFWTPLGRLK